MSQGSVEGLGEEVTVVETAQVTRLGVREK